MFTISSASSFWRQVPEGQPNQDSRLPLLCDKTSLTLEHLTIGDLRGLAFASGVQSVGNLSEESLLGLAQVKAAAKNSIAWDVQDGKVCVVGWK